MYASTNYDLYTLSPIWSFRTESWVQKDEPNNRFPSNIRIDGFAASRPLDIFEF